MILDFITITIIFAYFAWDNYSDRKSQNDYAEGYKDCYKMLSDKESRKAFKMPENSRKINFKDDSGE